MGVQTVLQEIVDTAKEHQTERGFSTITLYPSDIVALEGAVKLLDTADIMITRLDNNYGVDW